MPVMQNSSRPARQIAALIQCHECIVRYSSILRREFIASLFSTCGAPEGKTERERYMRRILICNAFLSMARIGRAGVVSCPGSPLRESRFALPRDRLFFQVDQGLQ